MKKFALGLMIVGAFWACKTEEVKNQRVLRKVKVTNVQKDVAVLSKSFSGSLQETKEVSLAFRIAGPIESIYIKEGQYVKKGDLIAEMDKRDYQIQLDGAEAQYKNVKAETERVKELYKRNSIADVDYEKAVSGEAMVATQLNHAKDQLLDTKLYAPFSGYIQDVNFEKGEMINTGMPLATLIDVSSYIIEVNIPTSLFLKKNDFVSYSCNSKQLEGEAMSLQLVSYNRKADNNQMYKLIFRLDQNAAINLAPGLAMEVNIKYKNPTSNPLYIPVKSVFQQDDKSFVWVYNEKDSVVVKKEVVTDGLIGDGNIRIVKGLDGFEKVITAGVNVLQEKQKVEVMEEASETNVGGLL